MALALDGGELISGDDTGRDSAPGFDLELGSHVPDRPNDLDRVRELELCIRVRSAGLGQDATTSIEVRAGKLSQIASVTYASADEGA